MIKVTYYKDVFSMTVRGHAGCAQNGHDLVCAGVTTLVASLANAFSAYKNGDFIDELTVSSEDGFAEITFKPAEGYDDVINSIWMAFAFGFLYLAELYPENVTFEIQGTGNGN